MSISPKFTLLSTRHLASQPPSSEITLQNLIDDSVAIAEEANEVLPYKFDECTYEKGYLRQSIWSCIGRMLRMLNIMPCRYKLSTCSNLRPEHRLVELWTKRRFRCDCPTTSIVHDVGTSPAKRQKCTLNSSQPQLPNEENKYNQNFKGLFCRCGRDYDPETETEAMLNCMGCEDWYHESCLHLRQIRANESSLEAEDEEDDERQVLIPSTTYDGLICSRCVEKNDFLEKMAGIEGWMLIEPGEGLGEWVVTGRVNSDSGDVQHEGEPSDRDRLEDLALHSGSTGSKRSRLSEDAEQSKRARTEPQLDGSFMGIESAASDIKSRIHRGAGDIFLAHGIREKLKSQLDSETIASLPFPLEDEETYEPPIEEPRASNLPAEETLDEVTNRVIGNLPRVQAIEALHGYQSMKDKLSILLRKRAENGQVVSKEDIDSFFAELQVGRVSR